MLSPRAEALRLVQSNQELTVPPLPDYEPDSEEALESLGEIKEQHYASLARTIDLLLDSVDNRSSQELAPASSGYYEKFKPDDPWVELASSLRNTFLEARERIASTAIYKNSEEFTQYISSLDSSRHMRLEWQLDGGVNTAVSTTLVLLRNLPGIVRYHDPDSSKTEITAIARHPANARLLRRPAKVCINQMMSAQNVLSGETNKPVWGDIDVVLKPELFKLNQYLDGSRSLDYVDFSGMEVPEGYTPYPTVEPVEEATLVKDIVCHQDKTIGCPVTLLQGRMAELLNWSLDLVEARGLWEEDWPPSPAEEKAKSEPYLPS